MLLYTFQVYNFIAQHLYTPWYYYHPKSILLPSPYIWPPPVLALFAFAPPPFPTGNHAVVWVWGFVCFVCCFLLCIPHVCEVMQKPNYYWVPTISLAFWSASCTLTCVLSSTLAPAIGSTHCCARLTNSEAKTWGLEEINHLSEITQLVTFGVRTQTQMSGVLWQAWVTGLDDSGERKLEKWHAES